VLVTVKKELVAIPLEDPRHASRLPSMNREGNCLGRTQKLSDAGRPESPNWRASRLARIRSSDLVGPTFAYGHNPDAVVGVSLQ